MTSPLHMTFLGYDGTYLTGDRSVDVTQLTDYLGRPLGTGTGADAPLPTQVFQPDRYGLDVEQTLNIGSQSTGAGAGKITFNPFSIDRLIDFASPALFAACASGTPFERVDLFITTASDSGSALFTYLQYTLKLAALKTIAYSPEDRNKRETVTFEYGGLQIKYRARNPDGSPGTSTIAGWNRVKNVRDISDDPIR